MFAGSECLLLSFAGSEDYLLPFTSPNLLGLVHYWFEVIGLVLAAAAGMVVVAASCLDLQHSA